MSAKTKRKVDGGAGSVNKVSDRAKDRSIPKAKGKAKLAKPAEALTRADKDRLQHLETAIKSGLTSFVTVGHALMKIKENQLYREEAKSFENYCVQKWGMSANYAYRQINAAKCFDCLKAGLPRGSRLPSNESQLRPLVEDLKPKQWVKTWKQVIADTKGVRPTADVVEKSVNGGRRKSSESSPKAHKKALPNMSKALATAVACVKGALERKSATTKVLKTALKSVLRKLKVLQGRWPLPS